MNRKFPLLLLFIISLCSFLPAHAAKEQEGKTVLIAILARNKAHVLPRFLNCIENLDYDKKLIDIYINTNNNDDNTESILKAWSNDNEGIYHEIIWKSHNVENLDATGPHEWTPKRFKVLGKIRNESMKQAKKRGLDYYFVVDCDNFIEPMTLKKLIKKKKPIIAPMLRAIPEPGDCYSNYFCDVSSNGYYKDHEDYMKILSCTKRGTFKVPVVHCTYLIDTKHIDNLNYVDGTDDYEFVIFSRTARKHGVGQYICNEEEFGTLIHFYDAPTLEQEVERYNAINFD